jgi:hypothetical protein
MASITVEGPTVRVSFSRREKLLGLVRDYAAPVASVTAAREVGLWRRELKGLRVGLGLPGVWLLGTWYARGHRQLVALRRHRAAVRVELRGEKYDVLLIECDYVAGVLSRLNR